MLRRFLLAFILPVLVLSQNVTVTTQDPSMHFEGIWVVQDSGGHEFTTTIGSSVFLNFTGTAIYWHATINPRCGIANVSVDNDAGVLVDASNGTNTNSTPMPAILFSRSGLEPGKSHLINISFFAIGELGGPYMEMYNLTCIYTELLHSFDTCRADRASDRYTQDNSTPITSGSAGSSTETSGSPNAEAVHQRSTEIIAGEVVGGVCGVGLILCFIFFVFRQRLRPLATPYTSARGDVTTMSQSDSIRVPPRLIVPASQLQASSPTMDSETIPSGNSQTMHVPPSQSSPMDSETIPSGNSQTTHVPPPQSSLLTLTLNRNESAPSILEEPPPPYVGRS